MLSMSVALVFCFSLYLNTESLELNVFASYIVSLFCALFVGAIMKGLSNENR